MRLAISLQREQREKPNMDDLLDEVRQRKQRAGSRISVEQIVELRDADRR